MSLLFGLELASVNSDEFLIRRLSTFSLRTSPEMLTSGTSNE